MTTAVALVAVACKLCGTLFDPERLQRAPGMNCPNTGCRAPLDATAISVASPLNNAHAEQIVQDALDFHAEHLAVATDPEAKQRIQARIDLLGATQSQIQQTATPGMSQAQIKLIVDQAIAAALEQFQKAASVAPAPTTVADPAATATPTV